MKALVLQWLRWMALGFALVAGASPCACGQQPGGNPFDGEWSLILDIATAPGGASMGGDVTVDYLYRMENRRFEVKPDGTFEWLAREAGAQHHDYHRTGGSVHGDVEMHLRGKGKVDPPPEEAASTGAGNRRLSVQLSLLNGNGRGSYLMYGFPAYMVSVASADLSQITTTTISPTGNKTVTIGSGERQVKWDNLRSTRVTRDEIAPDVVVETTVYRASRQATWRVPDQIPVTERIEVKHVRHLKLVPRG
jgi:hypothetical protein